MQRFLILILIFVLLISCQGTGPSSTQAVETETEPVPAPTSMPIATQRIPPGQDQCGNGICTLPETTQNCPTDCPPLTAPGDDALAASQPAPALDAVLYIGVMIHLEGWNDDENQGGFEDHALVMRQYASLFETYGAKLTWESKELTDGILKWGDNVLLEMQQRRHGVGVHADIGGEADYDCSRFTDDLAAEKKQLESLGINVRHLSGNTSHCDWVTASADAGYLFTTGIVAYNLMSLPEDQRPAKYRNCKSPAACHDRYPPDLADRIHPWRVNSGTDWLVDDPDGRVVLLAEGGTMPDKDEAIDSSISSMEQAISLSQPDKVNIYYFGKSIGQAVDLPVVEAWLQRIQPYADTGKVQWMTLPEMYDAYVAWEQGR